MLRRTERRTRGGAVSAAFRPREPFAMRQLDGDTLRVAYLSTLYPALSHTFVEREVRALRQHGIEVETFAMRIPAEMDLLGAENQEAARSTTYLLGSPFALAADCMVGLARHPLRFLKAFLQAQRISPPGLRARSLHLAYLLEAVHLAMLLRRKRLHHVHVHFANNGAVVALLARAFDATLTYSLTVHGPLEFLDVGVMRLDVKAANANFVRCISNFCRAQLMMCTDPEVWDRFFVAHCGLDPALFPPRLKQSHPGDCMRILALGRIVPMKGFHVLLDSCRRLGFPWHLDIVGEGPLRSALTDHAQRLGLAQHVSFHGAAAPDRIEGFMERADVLVVSSFLEGLPVVLMEAMAKELPVVATRVAGIPEIVEDGRTGLLVEPSDAVSLAAALERLGRDRELRRSLGNAGRKKVLAEFSIAPIARVMASALRTACAKGAS